MIVAERSCKPSLMKDCLQDTLPPSLRVCRIGAVIKVMEVTLTLAIALSVFLCMCAPSFQVCRHVVFICNLERPSKESASSFD